MISKCFILLLLFVENLIIYYIISIEKILGTPHFQAHF